MWKRTFLATLVLGLLIALLPSRSYAQFFPVARDTSSGLPGTLQQVSKTDTAHLANLGIISRVDTTNLQWSNGNRQLSLPNYIAHGTGTIGANDSVNVTLSKPLPASYTVTVSYVSGFLTAGTDAPISWQVVVGGSTLSVYGKANAKFSYIILGP